MAGSTDDAATKDVTGTTNMALRWLVPLGVIATLIGYFSPWINHAVAGLVITGLDLAEYIKFLPSVRGGTVTIWRQGFYAPLVAVSLVASLFAFRRELGYGRPMRVFMLLMAVVAALHMLPPAWTPRLLLTPEFRLQTAAIALCLGLAAISPFAALLPHQLTGAVTLILAIVAIWLPVQNFLRVLPDISRIYNQPQSPGWAITVTIAGLVALAVAGALFIRAQPIKKPTNQPIA